MNIRLFYHSLVSDWNHGNAHFLRGVAAELIARGHHVLVYEPAHGWSLTNLRAEHGEAPLQRFRARFPQLRSARYELADFDADTELEDADLVIVHEWNEPALVRRVAEARRRHGFVLLFHDTHHRLVTAPESMRALDLSGYDGVLACGEVLRRLYLRERLARRAWTWHEAADTRVFHPIAHREPEGDLVWIGNWGDHEHSEELREFLIEPVKALGLKARVHGVRYPDTARAMLAAAGIEYGGWLPNFDAPAVFASHKVTIHVPRRPYVEALPGVPTIRPFEALACGIPLVCSPWNDAKNLFAPGEDFLMARNGAEMREHLELLVRDQRKRQELAGRGLWTIRMRHTCAHRVDELLAIHDEIQSRSSSGPAAAIEEVDPAWFGRRAAPAPV